MRFQLLATYRARGCSLAAAALLLLGGARAAAAQAASTLQGQVVDSAGKPVAGQRLTLHRVNQTGGALVDSATTDAQGRFRIRIAAEPDTSAVFFAATRWQGQLYIGQPFKPPAPAGETYKVVGGVNPVQMGPATGGGAGGMAAAQGAEGGAGAAPVPASDSNAGRWFLVVVLALVAAGAAGYGLLGSSRDRRNARRREILARIAELDERAQGAAREELTALERERAELLAQLAE